ncbi:hypothetical protein FRC15_003747 [Serendipita sp. 397]|nr:hypothetical protein FRC15_003747 [Serendipita sp. 397]
MDCQICELHQKRAVCTNCSRTRIQEFKDKRTKIIKDRNTWRDQAERLLSTIEGPRTLRAESAHKEARIRDYTLETTSLERSNAALRTRLAALRTQVATRRANLLSARTITVTQPLSKTTVIGRVSIDSSADWTSGIDETNYRLAQSRSSLVEELLEAFDLAENETSVATSTRIPSQAPLTLAGAWNVSGFSRHASRFGSEFFLRPPVSTAKKPAVPRSPTWSICSLAFPLPKTIQQSLQKGITSEILEETNAAVTYTIHFINLLCFYLGVKLPFEIRWSGGRQAIGSPYLKASSGSSNGNWAKWIVPCAMYIHPRLATGQPNAAISTDAYTIAYTMLAYNVCYLAYTQAILIPLAQAGNILANLWTICSEDKSIGKYSHETSSASHEASKPAAVWPPVTESGVGGCHPLHHQRNLAAPTPSMTEFPLDFEEVMELLAGKKIQPPSETLTVGGLIVEEEGGEGWAVVDFDAEGL